MTKVTDVVIVGGGMIGAATAIGLAQLGLSVTVIEHSPPQNYCETQPLDVRVSAISVASEKLLERLGAWSAIKRMRNAVYTGLETWELDDFITQFDSQQINSSHLGHIIENRVVQLGLWQQLEALGNVEVLSPARVESFERKDGHDSFVQIVLDSGDVIDTKLLVGCDGAHSAVRQWAGIGLSGWDYKQSAMLVNIETQTPQQTVTWQQFTPAGPRSLLPLPGNNASLVWYDSPQVIAKLMQLNPVQLAQQIRQYFPERLDPNFTVVNKGAFPLTRRHANQYYAENVVILGDAAHTINPLAGQGVNLGFKDVDALVNQVAKALGSNQYWYAEQVLAGYQQQRYKDNLLMMTGMDAFYKSFSNNNFPVKVLRNLALKMANFDSPIKKKVLKYAMGLG
ncbi:FAD-dependent oxidoreductase [Parashewanella spongiae]|uniref:FAD-dependent oxidoreductase n=1 Tax=Parashewanella spongiae TaxID=342950 RepID=A0A3A6ULP8_9GAMM|nr:FAD-dependent oxidoreductase [Parashewanella spongiae]MCL1077304.1 FAD-dependent oxidoreductase [Parashewanella spongiae]RJY18609.1 FAD-dependent oxidoreductase [Parashewanella spongiae]